MLLPESDIEKVNTKGNNLVNKKNFLKVNHSKNLVLVLIKKKKLETLSEECKNFEREHRDREIFGSI